MRNMKVKDFFKKLGARIAANFRLKSIIFSCISLALLAADLLTKHFADVNGWQFKIIPGFVEVQHVVWNDGASLGSFSGYVPMLIALTFVALPVFIGAVLLIPERFTLLKFCVCMAFAGAVGNLVDRLAFFAVRDFIYMNFGFVDFVCNLADIWLVVGLVLAMADMLFLNEWAAFPLTKRAKAAQAAQKERENSASGKAAPENDAENDAEKEPEEGAKAGPASSQNGGLDERESGNDG